MFQKIQNFCKGYNSDAVTGIEDNEVEPVQFDIVSAPRQLHTPNTEGLIRQEKAVCNTLAFKE